MEQGLNDLPLTVRDRLAGDIAECREALAGFAYNELPYPDVAEALAVRLRALAYDLTQLRGEGMLDPAKEAA
jgi:hypothetical protein